MFRCSGVPDFSACRSKSPFDHVTLACELRTQVLRMGFFASYKRLSRKARIILGLVGVSIGLAGPYIVPLLPAADKPEEKLPLNEETAV